LTAALDRLRALGHTYQADGAEWLRTTDFGDDRDRVLVKRDGDWTYFAADCAYYLDKRIRGFDRVVIMLGADHHGYIGRTKAMAVLRRRPGASSCSRCPNPATAGNSAQTRSTSSPATSGSWPPKSGTSPAPCGGEPAGLALAS
jgi:hypothetical protein